VVAVHPASVGFSLLSRHWVPQLRLFVGSLRKPSADIYLPTHFGG